MSIRVVTAVWDRAPVKGSKLIVLLCIADHANDEGVCWPSIARIAERSRLSERHAQRVVRELEADELLQVAEAPGRPSMYLVNVTPDVDVTPTFAHIGGDIAMSGEPSIEPSEKKPSKEVRPTATELEREAIAGCWGYWLEVSGKNQILDDKRRRILRNALHTMRAAQDCELGQAEQLVKRALLGLARSAFHRGENEQRKQFMEIRYALKGRGDESDDERIEKAIGWAAIHAPEATSVDPDKIDRWLDDVRYYLGKQASNPQATSGRDRATEGYRALKGAGFHVVKLDKPPWARIER